VDGSLLVGALAQVVIVVVVSGPDGTVNVSVCGWEF